MAHEFAMVDCVGAPGHGCTGGEDRVAWTTLLLNDRTERQWRLDYRSAGDYNYVGVLDRYHRWAWTTERFI